MGADTVAALLKAEGFALQGTSRTTEAHSDKQGAAGTFKGGFGFHPLGRGWTAGMGPGRH